jgi:hypothetical protein
MAKTAKAKSGPKSKKKERPAGRDMVPATARKRRADSDGAGIDSLSKLLEHPIVAELISLGAIAAVAAIAEHNVKTRTGEGQKGSKKALKAAGSAAATAIGKRLMTEFEEIRKASKTATD